MTFKKIVGQIHLWLGFIAGLVVLISFLGAAVYVWEPELNDWYYHDNLFVVEQGDQALPFSEICKHARTALHGKKIEGAYILNDAARTYQFFAYKEATEPGFFCWEADEYYDVVNVDPYNGKASVVDMRYDWISLTMRLHIQLLLRYEIGHWIVGFATLFMFAMMITGIILWWPKNKAALKQRFAINWKAKWRRINYDIHNVGGFYTWVVVFVIATTGLVWTFDWWYNGLYRLYGGDPHHTHAEPPPLKNVYTTDHALDKMFAHASAQRDSWKTLYLSLPEQTDTLSQYHYVYITFNTHTAFTEGDSYEYHPASGELIHSERQEEKDFAEKMMGSNYDIHVGSIYGLPTKILASLVALFCASLPVTGFMIWWGRRNKNSAEKPVRRSAQVKASRPVMIK